ncbi:MAG TPA: DUF1579 family protein [Blastocatellia bacterium]|nr:DUF1579 family protein [Blastocatellia bacterium]
MARARKSAMAAVIGALVFCLVTVMAQEHGKEKPGEVYPQPKPGPEAEKLKFQLGTFKTVEKHESGPGFAGGEGKGTMTARLGPGGLSLITEYKSTGPMGSFAGHGLTVWDAEAGLYKMHWVDSFTAGSMDMTGRWEGKDLVFNGQTKFMGKTYHMKEVYTDITPTSYTLKMYMGESGPDALMFTMKAVRQ